ncbi:hypothetical protein KAV46_05145 [Candidatus Bathyarchaeota archaeon]|nr:hypothetical protein [Candidatus Bathyarchaeota archaeon]
MHINRKTVTGLETAIILVAFVITAAAFAFVVLNMGFLTAEKAQSVIGAGMREAGSSMLTDGGVIGQRSNVTGDQSDICLEKVTFYLKLSPGERAGGPGGPEHGGDAHQPPLSRRDIRVQRHHHDGDGSEQRRRPASGERREVQGGHRLHRARE